MTMLTGKPLTALAAFLACASLAGAVGVAVSGGLRMTAVATGVGGVAAGTDAARARAEVSIARRAEMSGDVAGALARYRSAAEIDPRLVDPRSAEFLGPSFEAGLKKWIAGLKRGDIPGGGRALSDASYLFRRMYGGCG